MTVFKQEMKQNKKTLIIWTASVSLMSFICLMMFSEMKGMVSEMDEMFSSMGNFTKAFGMDQMSIGTIAGFYGVECGNILGLGGGFLASLLAVNMLSKEEGGRTAEFLFTHPISRVQIITEKLIAVFVQILLFNLVFIVFSCIGIALLGEDMNWGNFALYHMANLFMQLEIAAICYGLSSYIRRGGLGAGLGLAAMFYFLNIISNITESAKVLKYITPFSYTEAADIFASGKLEMKYLIVGIVVSVLAIGIAYVHYNKKDITA
ncbi:ABC transporter permease subunit [Anaerosporobacter faecicola]|uniref:ABC transporter permease subunit n=1 Tax=Anaerosporobacter faecicola TaxID=2718714 RepID=UPI00143BABE2|nr:ABC transporter permease subunit [Anaerosporobacter faecicola]